MTLRRTRPPSGPRPHRSPLRSLALALAILFAGTAARAQSPAVLDAQSGIGRMDPTPAATLLLPYFEVDLDAPAGGLTTVFTVNNATAAPVLAHVTLWTDWALPTIDFDVYLTGFDVQSFDLAPIFATGVLPQTSPMISNQGDLSLPNALPAGCTEPGDLPTGSLPPILVQLIRQAHSGQAVTFPGFDGDCAGEDHGDDHARGFITVDVVQTCSTHYPSTPGYFDQIVGFDNVLWGDWFRIEASSGRLLGDTLVHLEADPAAFEPGDYTFYGRLVDFDGSDGREPLPTSWATRYFDGGAFAGATRLVVWRDPKTPSDPDSVPCGSRPAPWPLPSTRVIAFDEEENPEEPGAATAAFPIATQRVTVGGAALPVSQPFGWLHLDLNASIPAEPAGGVAQSWVALMVETGSGLGLGYDALPLDSALLPAPLPTPAIFSDSFESGDLSGWTSTAPLLPR